MPHRPMIHERDPREVLMEAIGDLSGIELTGIQVLCAIYKRPDQTASGLFVPKNNLSEDSYQGKVGLVVKLGPQAFDDRDDSRFGALGWNTKPRNTVKEGDWLFYRVSDGFPISINQVECRILEDVNVKGRVAHPDLVW